MPNESSRKIFAENLRHQLKKNRVTQLELSKAMGVSTATVSDWVNGRKYPRIDAMQALAEYFGMLMSQLTTDEHDVPAEEDDVDRLEALHQDPRLCLLFDRARKMSSEDVDFMLQFAGKILKERDGE